MCVLYVVCVVCVHVFECRHMWVMVCVEIRGQSRICVLNLLPTLRQGLFHYMCQARNSLILASISTQNICYCRSVLPHLPNLHGICKFEFWSLHLPRKGCTHCTIILTPETRSPYPLSHDSLTLSLSLSKICLLVP